jgi:hypothetical protein
MLSLIEWFGHVYLAAVIGSQFTRDTAAWTFQPVRRQFLEFFEAWTTDRAVKDREANRKG